MMPITPDEALIKVTLNLYDEDVTDMKRKYGQGWSTRVRTLVRQHVQRNIKVGFGGEGNEA